MRSSEEIARRTAELKAKMERVRRGPAWVKCAYGECGKPTTRPKFCSRICGVRFHCRTVLPMDEYRRLGGLNNPIYSAFRDPRLETGFYRFNR